MAIAHLTSGEPLSVLPYGTSLSNERTVALFKSEELELIRLVLPAGKAFPSHKVAGEITIQCLEGELEITVEGVAQTLHANQLMFLAGGVTHDVLAVRDASALVTIVLHR